MAYKRDVIGNVDLRVLLNARGEVQEIKKISGSGDPFFDLALLGVLRKAVFDTSRVSGGYWLKIKFRVRAESGYVPD
jgi:TonB family protein